ncbi:MAG: hypothetical protein L0Z48_05615 [candidate division Zixibacteria bacterium]|nr:hypothetical protein [candidate division Zixibacteria bacterium]MCI0596002.1 hypothetical protein [candidate division Zixibacteria bacterium]
MKKIGGIVLIFAMALFGLALAQKGKKEEPLKTITGQVVDYECCSKSNGTMLGGDHQECAETCLKNGLPIGILTKDKKLYVAVSSQMMSSKHRELLTPLVNKQVKVTGKVSNFGGNPSIAVVSVEEME